MRKTAWDFECAIIGGGPAGLTAALYLARFQRRIALFQHGTPRLEWAPRIHNFPGSGRPISGAALLDRFRRSLARYGEVKTIRREGVVRRRGRGFEVSTPKGDLFTARTVLLATGVEDEHPALRNLLALRKKGLLRYCSICDGFEMREKHALVIAKDDAGIQKALFIARWTKNIRILLSPLAKISPSRQKQIDDLGIEIARCRTFALAVGSGAHPLELTIDGRSAPSCAIAYAELGCEVKGAALRHLRGIRSTEGGFIIASSEQRTTVRGLYAAGDCVNRLGQVSVASGQAAVAAANIHEELFEP